MSRELAQCLLFGWGSVVERHEARRERELVARRNP